MLFRFLRAQKHPGSFASSERSISAIAQMLAPEQEILSALIFALKPERVLEIGTCEGGSAEIIVGAMERRGRGKMICVDPRPQIKPELWASLSKRAELISDRSPDCLPKAVARAGGRFDLCLIDGDHSYKGAKADLLGCLPFLKAGAHIFLHDAHYVEVAKAIDDALRLEPSLTDCGMISTDHANDAHNPKIRWGGLYLCRYWPYAIAADQRLAS